MARHNQIYIYGQVSAPARIPLGRDRAMIPLNLIKADRNNFNTFDSIRYDSPLVITGNPFLIDELERLKPNDIIEIKGFLNTKDIKKSRTCPSCGNRRLSEGNISYISPAHLIVHEKDITKEQSFEFLKKNAEISNQVLLVGQLCTDPEVYHEKKDCSAQYVIAVNRKHKENGDPAELRTDYIHIKSYGRIAQSDEAYLRTGTLVLVEGMIQTRSFIRTDKCENCGREYTWSDQVMEVVPYSVEYLQDFNTPGESNGMITHQMN